MASKKHDLDNLPKSKRGGVAPQAPLFRAAQIKQPNPALFVSGPPPRLKDDPDLSHQSPGKSLPVASTPSPKKLVVIPSPVGLNPGPGWMDPQLTTVGLYYPLGPCQTTLPQSDLDKVLRDLVGVFRTQSLQTVYTDSPISAVCRSLDSVELEVLLFASREDPDQMILEVSRRDGDSVLYHAYAHQILLAVSGEATEAEPLVRPSWNTSMLSQADNIEQGNTENVAEAVEIAWGLVSDDRYDARKLGMESVVHMTDPNKSGWSTAKAVTECLMRPQGAIEERLSKTVLQYACQDVPVPVADDERSFSDAFEADFSYLGLIIMSQALQVASGAQTMDVQAFLDVCPSDVVGSVLQKANNAQRNPHHAYYAYQCLAALCHCVPSTKSRIKGVDVEEAQLVGESCHLALATITQKLLINLQA